MKTAALDFVSSLLGVTIYIGERPYGRRPHHVGEVDTD